MSDATPMTAARAPRTLPRAILLLLCSVPLGLLFVMSGLAAGGPDGSPYFVTLHLFVAQDIWAGPLIALMIGAAVLLERRGALPAFPAVPRWGIAAAAALSVMLVAVLRFAAHLNYNLAIDEFFPHFQAEIFRGGNLLAPLSDQAFALRNALQPYFTYVDTDHQLWSQHYRPVHAAILSLFPRGYEVACAHAILTGVTVFAMAQIARQLFPDRRGAPLLAAGLLIASPQVLLTAASGFAFTTHLAFNTVWLALFLRGTWGAHFAAAALSFFALGIHQVHVHTFYAFPFGVAMLLGYFGSRWKAVPYLVVFLVGIPFWIMWPEIATWLQTGDAAALPRSLLEVEYLSNYINRSGDIGQADRQFSIVFLLVNVWRFILWMSPALVLLLVLTLAMPRRVGAVAVIAGLGVLFNVAISHLMLPNQMLTIGSRYYHPLIGSLVLIAVAAYYRLADDPSLRRIAVAVLVVGAVVLLPWRAWQMREQIAPRADIQAHLNAMDAERILVQQADVWFALDFVRNDPYLRGGPTYFAVPEGAVVDTAGEDSVLVTDEDLVEMGLTRWNYP